MGPSETEAPPPKVVLPVPPGLPGKGMAQHSMLYIGEGCNKMFLVDKGKIIWTYSTGPGNEYDDVWMLSNGNVLFTRMQYIAEVTPDKKVVWRYDAPAGTEIHACQPIGLDKVLFIEEWPAASPDGRQHQDECGGSGSHVACAQFHGSPQRASAVPARALARHRELTCCRS